MTSDIMMMPRRSFLTGGVAFSVSSVCLGTNDAQAFLGLIRLFPALARFAFAVAAGAFGNIASDLFKQYFGPEHRATSINQMRRQAWDGFSGLEMPAPYRAPSHVIYPVANTQRTDFRVPITFFEAVYPEPIYDGDTTYWPNPEERPRDLGFLCSHDVFALSCAAGGLQNKGWSSANIRDLLMPTTLIIHSSGSTMYSSPLAQILIQFDPCSCGDVYIQATRYDNGYIIRDSYSLWT